jgi:hypothetical protein
LHRPYGCAKRGDVIIAVLLLGLVLASPVLINAAVYLDRRNALRRTCEGNDPLPWAITASAFLVECGALALSAGAHALGAIARRPAIGRDRGHLVILVAGYGLPASSFWLLERRLRRLGWDTAVMNDGAWRTPPDRAAEELGKRIRRVREGSPARVASVLAFGCTGLLVRRWLRDAPAAPLQQLITLGTPHRGTLGLLSRLDRFRFVHPSSSFLQDLAEGDPVPGRFDAIAISSEFDAWVVPNDAAYYPGAFNVVVRDIGHFTLLLSKRIADLVAENLATAGTAQRRVTPTAAKTHAASSLDSP